MIDCMFNLYGDPMRVFIGLLILFYTSISFARQCIDDNRLKCTALGFTQTSCPYGGVACPYDKSKWYCANWTCEDGRLYDNADEQYWTDCDPTSYKDKNCFNCWCEIPTPDCQIGDMFYADKTCTKKYGDCLGKQPIGIVFMLTDQNGNISNWNEDGTIDYNATSRHGRIAHTRVLSLEKPEYKFNSQNPYDGGQNRVYWGLYTADCPLPNLGTQTIITEILAATNHEGTSLAFTGKANTPIIAQTPASGERCTTANSYETSPRNFAGNCFPSAAYSCQNFYLPEYDPNDPFLGTGQWYLPAIGELLQMRGVNPKEMTSGGGFSGDHGTTWNKITTALNMLKKKGIPVSNTAQDFHWSSSEVHYAKAWAIRMSDGYRATPNKNYDTPFARPCLQF